MKRISVHRREQQIVGRMLLGNGMINTCQLHIIAGLDVLHETDQR
ncbi:hypothetical protein QM797_04185 [Rhodococcus sp. IEGM 1381]|nr:hypothetical protein [Rhodococcus sp. IEGM 1381]MDI9893914.1 hypothetical protein [Rhodococcus sp. IEGM 1381]